MSHLKNTQDTLAFQIRLSFFSMTLIVLSWTHSSKAVQPPALSDCNNPKFQGFPVQGIEKTLDRSNPISRYIDLLPECSPDTVYSWIPAKEADLLFIVLSDPVNWKKSFKELGIRNGTYAALTPVSTFLYGSVSVRIKLRRFPARYFPILNADRCKNALLNPPRKIKIVGKMLGNAGRSYEIQLCRPDVIESISMAMPEHLTEMENDLRTQIENPAKSYAYLQGDSGDRMLDINNEGRPFLYSYSMIDQHREPQASQTLDSRIADYAGLVSRVEAMKLSVKKGMGRILVNPFLTSTAEDHFGSALSTYYQR